MKQLLFLLFLPCLALAQYQGNANQKITLGEQTTADGLVYRGVAADTTLTVKSDTAAYFVLDTVNLNLYTYKASASGRKWRQLGADTAAIAYVNTYGTQTVNGAKTFTSAVTATRFNPTASTDTGTGMYLPATNTLGFSTNGTNKMTLDASGNLGVGYANPSSYEKLAVNGAAYFGNTGTTAGVLVRAVGINNTTVSSGTLWADSAPLNYVENRSTTANTAAGYAMQLGGGNAIAGILGIAESTSQASLGLYTGGSGTVAEKMRITSGGEVWIGYTADNGAYILQVKDSVYVGGNVSASAYTTRSDYDLKDEIQNINYGINEVMQMQPVKYTYKSNGSTQLGFIAQDLGVITPEVVSFEDKMSVYYNALIPILTKAIQEQQALINALEQRIINLENK